MATYILSTQYLYIFTDLNYILNSGLIYRFVWRACYLLNIERDAVLIVDLK